MSGKADEWRLFEAPTGWNRGEGVRELSAIWGLGSLSHDPSRTLPAGHLEAERARLIKMAEQLHAAIRQMCDPDDEL